MSGGEVVLVPGLWMPGIAMKLLALRLARRGYRARVFDYRGREPYEANMERLARVVGAGPAHLVGHSMGGVLILDTLNAHRDLTLRSALLIGSPACGCFAGRRLGRASIGRWMMGASRPLWEEREAAWRRAEPLGVIAGTAPLGLGRALGALPGPNDGVVRVDETTVRGMKARALVPAGHSALIVSARVADLACRFLAAGTFD